jgi:hypothetical protein
MRPELPGGKAVEVEMLSIPDEEQVTVRFLSEPRSILTHWDNKRPRACPGKKDCPAAIHRSHTTWKFYAAIERWRERPFEDWIPEVLEGTENLWRVVNGKILRGTVWTLFRQLGRHGKRELTGEQVDEINADHLRTDIVMENTVMRVFRTDDIMWDVPCFIPAVSVALPSKDAPPKNARRDDPRPDPTDRAAYKAWIERQKRKAGQPVMNGQANGNEKH